ncbi:MAG: hypothetical protein LQ349_006306 [Xanthoria aureola]|nr:MAG: hypothetical protein LQ349_006306 [Xanthoria aureola]
MPAALEDGIGTTNACKHYDDARHVPWDIKKYYHQRYSLFSRYDDGILMTDTAWFGVTPEPVANKVAQHLSEGAPASKAILIDCFAGVGGNTIAFARSGRWKRVYAIEKDENAMLCGKHNARLYGVDGLISWFHGDCFEVMKNELEPLSQHSVVFASPPWGGPGYSTDPVFNLESMDPYSLDELLDSFQQFTQEVVLFLPRTSDLRQLASANHSLGRVKAIHYCMQGASKGICAYFGLFASP